MKLELKHLQHYPIGGENALKFLISFDNKEIVGSLKSIEYRKTDLGYDLRFINHKEGLHDTSLSAYLFASEFSRYPFTTKPILRPMSDLYKEINGKIDIVELAKIGTGCKDWIVKEYTPMIGGKIKLKSYTIIFNEEFNLRFHYKDGSFFLYSMADATNEYLVDQLSLFEYLFSHHYDIYGLLEQNLAININEIKE